MFVKIKNDLKEEMERCLLLENAGKSIRIEKNYT